jgi:hypothetical protein
MGNGVIIGFPGFTDDPDEIAQENANKATVTTFYDTIWRAKRLESLENLLAPDFTLHRNNEHWTGIEAMRGQIIITQMNYPDLEITIDEIAALRQNVACRLTLRLTKTSGEKLRIEGMNVCRLEQDLIVESAVVYKTPEPVP